MHRYIFLLSTYILRKWALLIITFFGIVATCGVFIPMANASYMTDGSTLMIIPGMAYIIPFVFSSLFSVFIYNYAFKDGEKDGSELIILTKPISRNQIFLSKITVLFGYIFINSIIYLIIFSIVGSFDEDASGSQMTQFIFSGWMGTLIVQVLFAPLMILVGTMVGKIGVLVVTILLTALLPVASMIMMPLGSYTQDINFVPYDSYYQIYDMSTLNVNDENSGVRDAEIKPNEDSYTIVKDTGVYLPSGEFLMYDVDNEYGNPNLRISDIQKYENYIDKVWYDTFAYFDIWYQWSRFYSMFYKREFNVQADSAMLRKTTEKLNFSPSAGMEVVTNGVSSHYIVSFGDTTYNSVNAYFNNDEVLIGEYGYNGWYGVSRKNYMNVKNIKNQIWAYMEKPDYANPGKTNIQSFYEEESLINRIFCLANVVWMLNGYNGQSDDEITMTESMYVTRGEVVDHWRSFIFPKGMGMRYHFEVSAMLYKLITQKYTIDYVAPSTAKYRIKLPREDVAVGSIIYTNLYSERLLKNGSQMSTSDTYCIEVTGFVETWVVVLIWVLLGIALYALSFWRYTRIDFK